MLDVCELLGVKKVNTTAYHPQTDGLVERMNRTLRSMLAKHVHKFGPDWDVHLQQLLFAYVSFWGSDDTCFAMKYNIIVSLKFPIYIFLQKLYLLKISDKETQSSIQILRFLRQAGLKFF